MRIDYRKIIAYWILMLWSVCMLLWLTGCSAQYHLNRYQTKGGTCGKIDTIKIQKYDTILNKYYYHDSLVVVNDRVVPLTRQEIRYMYKIHHDTLKHKETIVKEKIRYEKAKDKNERKMKTSPWILGVVILGLVALILILLRFR
jgi:hypothetical protein